MENEPESEPSYISLEWFDFILEFHFEIWFFFWNRNFEIWFLKWDFICLKFGFRIWNSKLKIGFYIFQTFFSIEKHVIK